MMSKDEELIQAQNQVIGILFEVIKRLQTNNNLDEEYFEIIANPKSKDTNRLDEILKERRENANIASRLLAQLED